MSRPFATSAPWASPGGASQNRACPMSSPSALQLLRALLGPLVGVVVDALGRAGGRRRAGHGDAVGLVQRPGAGLGEVAVARGLAPGYVQGPAPGPGRLALHQSELVHQRLVALRQRDLA